MSGELVLLVDDDEGMALLHRRVLEREGYRIAAVHTPEEALEHVRAEAPALLMLDYRLGGAVTGLDFYHRLRSEGFDLPAILVTAFSDEKKLIEALRAGIRDVVPKTTGHLEYLPHAVRRVMQQVQAEKQLVETEALRREVAERQRTEAERLRLYQQAIEANRLKDEFLAILSHELRTPLNVINGYACMLGRSDLDPEFRSRGLSAIRRSSEALQRIVDNLFDTSAIINGKIRLDIEPVALPAIAADVAEEARAAAAQKGVSLSFEAREGASVLADRMRVRQIVSHLVANAVKFTDSGGCVHITVNPRDEGVVLEVRDTGAGIDPAFLPYVFDRFRQGDSSASRNHGGLGLGLAIARELTMAMGGTISAESGGAAQGARFAVWFPVVEAASV